MIKGNSPSLNFNDAKRAIDLCMQADQHAFYQALKRLIKQPSEKQASLWLQLANRIAKSSKKRALRQVNAPKISYPESLPVAAQREQILNAINQHQVIIVCGETGSGKSTQLPKFLLEAGYGIKGMIAHTQPRRIAARSLAARISDELHSELGKAVGYKVRFNDQTSPETYIKLLTDGMLLNEMSEDRFLNQYDAIIIDEAHERSLNIDILLGLLNTLIKKRPDLKVIITSATINSEIFANFFARVDKQKQQIVKAPILEVSGRTYPVSIHYRPLDANDYPNHSKEDAWLAHAKKTTEHCINAHNGDVLFFLPTERDINDVYDYFNKHLRHHIERLNVQILRLYARLSLAEQQKVLHPRAQSGTRVILTTNIAETSLTVPNIRYVIDSGTARILRFNPSRRISQLPIEKISQASANQRSGRSGRVQDGVCYRLYNEDDFNSRMEYSQPEITRSSLTDVILKLKSLQLDANTFQWLEAPQQRLINDGLRQLTELGALDNQQNLTKLGRQLSQIPIDTRIARILLASHQYHCFADVAIIAAFLSTQDPRIINNENRSQAIAAQKCFEDKDSDFVVLLNIWQQYHEQRKALSVRKLRLWCEQHFLSWITLNECRLLIADFERIAKQLKLEIKSSSTNIDNIHKSLLTGFVSNIAKRDPHYQGGGELYQGCYDKKVRIFPGSCLAKKKPNWIVSADQIETSAIFARFVAIAHPRWIEECASHLIHQEYLAPFWNNERGEVSCVVKKSLFGIVLSNNSITNFGKINAKHSQEILIQRLLLPQEYDNEMALQNYDDAYDNIEDSKHASASHFNLHQNQLPHSTHKNQYHPSIDKVSAHAIIKSNSMLFQTIEKEENTLRNSNIRVSDEQLIAWFSEKLPNDIVSAPQLLKFLNGDKCESLRLSIDDLRNDDALKNNHHYQQHYPEQLQVVSKNNQVIKLNVDYLFDIASESDGVTVNVLISQLNQLSGEVFEWLIPAWLDEKIIASLRTLSKTTKQKLPPVKSVFDDIKKQLLQEFPDIGSPSPINMGLYQYLCQFIKKNYRFDIKDELNANNVHPQLGHYLKAHFCLIDNQNEVIASGDNFNDLQIKFYQLSQASLQSSSPFNEVYGATDWQFGEIPKKISISQNNQVITAFPTLMDEGESVRYYLTHNAELSVSQTREAITRLLILHLPQQVNYIVKKLPDLKQIATLYSPIGRASDLIKNSLFQIFTQTFFPSQKNNGQKNNDQQGNRHDNNAKIKSNNTLPRNENAFNALANRYRDKLLINANEYFSLILSILTAYHSSRASANKLANTGFEQISDDINEHLDWLVYEDFIEETPFFWLAQFPRYLKATELRCERALSNPQKDTQKTAILSRYWQSYLNTLTNQSDKIQDVNAFAEYGWALEEFRLSLYAQEMKTIIPVSEKKLQQLWQSATRLPLSK